MSNRLKLDVLFILCMCTNPNSTKILYMTSTTYTTTVAQNAMKFDIDVHGSQRILSEELAMPWPFV